MRCGCPVCGTYMIQQTCGEYIGCRCPACDYRCDACMGTDTVLSRDDIENFRNTGIGRLEQIRQYAEEDTASEDAVYQEVAEESWMDGSLND